MQKHGICKPIKHGIPNGKKPIKASTKNVDATNPNATGHLVFSSPNLVVAGRSSLTAPNMAYGRVYEVFFPKMTG
jgi:hypothetical protein